MGCNPGLRLNYLDNHVFNGAFVKPAIDPSLEKYGGAILREAIADIASALCLLYTILAAYH